MGEAAVQARPGRRPWWRVTLLGAAVATMLFGSATIAYRVLAPAEIVTGVTVAYPAATPVARPGVIGTLAAAPLIVDGRLRVYAAKRQIRADAPVDARTQRSPVWSYRRWPEQLVGVVAIGTTVVGRWSDGKLVAIDGRTGQVRWRTDGPAPDSDEYAGRRTGASTLYTPEGLYGAGGVVVVRSATRVIGVDAAGGRELWRLPGTARECWEAGFTTVDGRLALARRCHGERVTVEFYDSESGRLVRSWRSRSSPASPSVAVVPLGCRVGHTECAGMRIEPVAQAPTTEPSGAVPSGGGPDVGDPALAGPSGGGVSVSGGEGPNEGWLLRGPGPVPAPALAPVGAWLVEAPGLGDLAVSAGAGGRLVARRADTGKQVWNWLPGTADPLGRARVVAAQPGRVHLLTGGYWLVTVDARTGVELSRFAFTYGRERTGWTAGHAYAAGGFVLLERLAAGANPAASDRAYYFIAQPVLLAST